MVIETSQVTTRVDNEETWQASGLRLVDSSAARQVVAFSDDPQMREFLGRVARYREGPPPGNKSAYLEAFFDSIIQIRPFGRPDRVGRDVESLLGGGRDDQHVVDIELWHPGAAATADRWLADVRGGLEAGGGDVLDTFISQRAGVIVLRARLSVDQLDAVLDVDLVALVEVPPPAIPGVQGATTLTAADLADVPQASADAPVVGMVDSGVVDSHPLLSGSVVAAVTTVPALGDGYDRNGHGTAVAGLLLHGLIDEPVASGRWLTPPCGVLSVRVLDHNAQLPEDHLPETVLEGAVRYLAGAGVRVINLSVGDSEAVYTGGRATRLAAVLDGLARELDLVLVVPTGRVAPSEYDDPRRATFSRDYVQELLDEPLASLGDPGPAALALTVGGLVPPLGMTPVPIQPIGLSGWPSPFTRHGPGVGGGMKPDLVAPAGTLGQDRNTFSLVRDASLEVRVADGRPGSSGVVTSDIGTSLATPLVSRVVATAEGSFPAGSANLLRALVLQSAVTDSLEFEDRAGLGDGTKKARRNRMFGYGIPRADRAVTSAPGEVILYAEDSLRVNSVHLYAVPIPDSFFLSGRMERGISVSLAFDPLVRARRLDYMSSRMHFELLRGIPAQEVLDLFLADVESDENDPATLLTPVPMGFRRVSDIPAKHRIPLSPSRNYRITSANQVGAHTWRSGLRRELGSEFLLVIQNFKRWHDETAMQDYAVTVRLWVDEKLPPIYQETRARATEARARARAEMRAGR